MGDSDAKKYFEKALNYYKEKKFDLVEENLELALKLAPDRISILENLVSIYFLNKKFTKSKKVIDRLKELGVENNKIDEIKFYVLKKLSKFDELFLFLKKKNYFKNINKKIFIISKLLYPSFFKDNKEIEEFRNNLIQNVNELDREENLKLSLDGDMIEPPIFNLSYDQHENLDLNTKIVKIFRKIYPGLNQSFKNKNENKKKIDVLFTGQINNYRKKIFSNIDKKIHVESILNYKTRDKLYNDSKILICLSKNNFQNKSSTNRTFLAIKKNIIPLIQKCLNEDQLDSFAFISETKYLNSNINKILNNYEKYYSIFQKKRYLALKKYNANKFEKKLKSFF